MGSFHINDINNNNHHKLFFILVLTSFFISNVKSFSSVLNTATHKKNGLNYHVVRHTTNNDGWKSTTTTGTCLFDTADPGTSTPTSDDAAALTEFMARAHEEKIRAMNRVEAQYKNKIEELEAKIEELEGPNTGSEATSANSFAFPATNKHLTEKVSEYRKFIGEYMIKSQVEKQLAVKAAEERLVAKYEAMSSE